ncbi:MAG: neutral/alkaline non-lysosomal ceramidase N-terminal domain-containing protein [Thermoguttaceae bacterium]|nr:neutral/alkaline non-lysosomal ceramidase N-terminal domain-containing protein [Thermoguttaceae bacterium]MDW8077726.1 neutral/alkaline non-lysosomal ceramidase N-terminal domain-containing protein [Thermoguttaceae bacterium]
MPPRAPDGGTKMGFSRRQILGLLTTPAWALLPIRFSSASEVGSSPLLVGDATFDITPPLGAELAGYHRIPGQERRVQGIRQRAEGRVLVLTAGDLTACVAALDLCAVAADFTAEVRRELWQRWGIPASNVHLCASHTHSMPSLRPFRQWGGVLAEYVADVKSKLISAVGVALESQSRASLRVGKAKAVGASFNRTAPTWRNEDEFSLNATAETRWLDRELHALVFERQGRQPVVWYHFSAHPVCFADEQAGPDWCGPVADEVERVFGVRPGFLQGHAGDVNPGPGNPWRGDVSQVSQTVVEALRSAFEKSAPVEVWPLRSAIGWCRLPLDLQMYRQWLDAYRANPEACSTGHWVDQHFAKSWYEDHSRAPWEEQDLLVEIGLLRLGDVALVFHPAELYSYYGLWIRSRSPVAHTLVVGYANDIIGYLPDPMAFEKGEYAAITVPKILDLPPFRPEAAQVLASRAVELLNV